MDGTKTAVDLVMAAGAAVDADAEPEQLDLLGLPAPKSSAGRALVAEHRGRGRPPGSRNKRTQRTVEWLLSRYRDPRETLLAISTTPVEVLAASLGCKPIEALQEIRLAAIAVQPFMAQKQPLAVNVNQRSIALTIVENAADLPPDAESEIIEIQGVSDDDDAAV